MDDMPALVDVIEEDEASGSVSTFVYAPPSYAASATMPPLLLQMTEESMQTDSSMSPGAQRSRLQAEPVWNNAWDHVELCHPRGFPVGCFPRVL